MTSQKERWAERAEQLEGWAAKAEARAAALRASRPSYADDWAFATQPSRSSAKVARDRRALNERDQRAWQLDEKAKTYRDKAANLRTMVSRQAGDAEAERVAKREGLSDIQVGDLVDSIYGHRRVIKINAKSLRLEGALGPLTIDKALCRKVAA